MAANPYLLHRLDKLDRLGCALASDQVGKLSNLLLKKYDDVGDILLFGSRVNGCPDDESDYDVYILPESPCVNRHELRTVPNYKLDVHVMTTDDLVSNFRREEKTRFCFYIKSVSESVVIYGKDEANNIVKLARSLYVSPGHFNGWSLMKINLDSRLSGFWRERPPLGQCMYLTDVALDLLRVLSMMRFGWIARIDVMLEWMRDGYKSDLQVLSKAYCMAVGGNPDKLFALCRGVSTSLNRANSNFDNFSVTVDGRVDYLE